MIDFCLGYLNPGEDPQYGYWSRRQAYPEHHVGMRRGRHQVPRTKLRLRQGKKENLFREHLLVMTGKNWVHKLLRSSVEAKNVKFRNPVSSHGLAFGKDTV